MHCISKTTGRQVIAAMQYSAMACDTARSVEDETRNAEFNDDRNPECRGDFSQLVTSRKSNISVSHGTKSIWDFDCIRIPRYPAVQIQNEIFVEFEFAVD